MLTSKQRAYLKKEANSLDAIFQIGKGGINDAAIKSIGEALEVRELIKCRVLESSPLAAKEAANHVAEAVGADVVQVIGSRMILYKKSEKEPKIELPK